VIAPSSLSGPGDPDLLIISGRAALQIFGIFSDAAAAIHHLLLKCAVGACDIQAFNASKRRHLCTVLGCTLHDQRTTAESIRYQ
jgi:hypothetical protein